MGEKLHKAPKNVFPHLHASHAREATYGSKYFTKSIPLVE